MKIYDKQKEKAKSEAPKRPRTHKTTNHNNILHRKRESNNNNITKTNFPYVHTKHDDTQHTQQSEGKKNHRLTVRQIQHR